MLGMKSQKERAAEKAAELQGLSNHTHILYGPKRIKTVADKVAYLSALGYEVSLKHVRERGEDGNYLPGGETVCVIHKKDLPDPGWMAVARCPKYRKVIKHDKMGVHLAKVPNSYVKRIGLAVAIGQAVAQMPDGKNILRSWRGR